MKEVGLELGFGTWTYLNKQRGRMSRNAIYISCTKKSVFFRRDSFARAKYQQISILLDLKHCIKFQEACRAMVCAHQKLTRVCSIKNAHLTASV